MKPGGGAGNPARGRVPVRRGVGCRGKQGGGAILGLAADLAQQGAGIPGRIADELLQAVMIGRGQPLVDPADVLRTLRPGRPVK